MFLFHLYCKIYVLLPFRMSKRMWRKYKWDTNPTIESFVLCRPGWGDSFLQLVQDIITSTEFCLKARLPLLLIEAKSNKLLNSISFFLYMSSSLLKKKDWESYKSHFISCLHDKYTIESLHLFKSHFILFSHENYTVESLHLFCCLKAP